MDVEQKTYTFKCFLRHQPIKEADLHLDDVLDCVISQVYVQIKLSTEGNDGALNHCGVSPRV